MKYSHTLLAACLVFFSGLGITHAKELDYLQTDPRFTGGEYNTSDPTHPNFWFYDQYQPARMALEADGVSLVPVTAITLPALVADSDAFYLPAPTNPSASAYPLTNAEISTLQQYVANAPGTGGRSVIFDLSGVSPAMTRDLLTRLGLSGQEAGGVESGPTSYPLPNQTVILGPVAPVGCFTMSNADYFNSLGALESLVNVNGESVLPYVEKGALSSTSGAYFFLLDGNLMSWNSQCNCQQDLFMNLVNYATQDQVLHYAIPAQAPEPSALVLLGLGGMACLVRRRQSRI